MLHTEEVRSYGLSGHSGIPSKVHKIDCKLLPVHSGWRQRKSAPWNFFCGRFEVCSFRYVTAGTRQFQLLVLCRSLPSGL